MSCVCNAHRGQKSASDSLKLNLQIVVTCHLDARNHIQFSKSRKCCPLLCLPFGPFWNWGVVLRLGIGVTAVLNSASHLPAAKLTGVFVLCIHVYVCIRTSVHLGVEVRGREFPQQTTLNIILRSTIHILWDKFVCCPEAHQLYYTGQ